jgi:hypothetical protein
LDDLEFATRLIEEVNISGDDWNGDGKDGYLDQDLFPETAERREITAMTQGDKQNILTKEVLARQWGIGLSTAHRTLKRTTQ